ncbi:alpha/beta fold hydrolase [Agarilytica rhodophyticola]|uniref:alpha/beta fold hydrolase n=1 Tax=Agarilytica rhodophyticola TaxID=1737490 RepID=UPI000B341BC0|nr:alpha/beta hydrolase [Agarilytica rhodophyticola]
MQYSTIRNISLKGKMARHLHISNPQKPILVFIPGNLQEIETIKDFNLGLSRYFDYHVVELPGTGMTTPLHPSYDISYLASCLEDFINNELYSSSIHLVSCSYATGVALEYAKENSIKIDKLVLAGSMQDIPEEEWSQIFMMMSNCLHRPKEFSKGFLDLITSESSTIPKHKVIKRATLRKAEKYTEDQFKCFIYNSIRLMSYKASQLETITCPTMCFTGELDPYVTPKRCKALADNIPNTTFRLIPNTDHLFHIEKPMETIDMICDYLLGKSPIAA